MIYRIIALNAIILVILPALVLSWQKTPRISDTKIIIKKGPQTLELLKDGKLVKKYRVCLGVAYGHKRITGDCRTPEGNYYVCYKSRKSDYHLFMGLSYPGIKDAEVGYETGLITKKQRDHIVSRVKSGKKPPWNTKLGGWIGIHGYPTDLQKEIWTVIYYPKPHNWTEGCIAMWSDEIKELYSMTPIGTPVEILPGPPPPPMFLFDPKLDFAGLGEGPENSISKKNRTLPFKLPELRLGDKKNLKQPMDREMMVD